MIKCFCHFNGYDVKDAAAREGLEQANARLNNLVANSGEQTEGNTELIDIRTAADGTVYPTAGDSVRGQITDLKSDLSTIESCLLKEQHLVFDKWEGYYVTGTGALSKDNSTHTSNPVEVGNSKWLYLKDVPVESGFYCIGFYVSNDISYTNSVGVYAHTDASVKFIQVPNRATHFVYSYLANDEPGEIYMCKIAPHETTFFEPKNLFNENGANLIGSYYNSTNTLSVNPEFGQSELIPVVSGGEYTTNETGFLVNWYDMNGNLVSSVTGTVFKNNGYVVAPENAAYARFMFTVADMPDFYIRCISDDSMTIKRKYLPKVSEKKLEGKKFTSYGDSITARNGWQPRIVGYYGLEHTNLGIGSTTLAYVESVEESYPCMVNAERIQAVKDSNPDILTILGGANDVVRNVPVGTTAELSNALGEKNKTTFIGALSYLVETMLAWKPTLNIILLTTTYSNVASDNVVYTQYAEAVREVAYYYGLKVADTNRESGITQFNTGTYTSDGIHPNDAGCLKIANIVASKIDELYHIN